eukprot:1140288-Pelagomonas_calceolata.AAC.1
MFCQGSNPHTSQPFSQINNKIPHDYRLPRLNTMSEHGSVIQHKNDSPPLVGSGVFKPGRDTNQSSQQLQLHVNPNGRGPTNTINRAELAGIIVALQQGHTDIASDSASCLSQISKQTLNPMRTRTHLHAELIQAISDLLKHSPHPGLTPVHALQHSWTPRILHFRMPGIPSTISTGFP